ncbi:MAG: hypothetical protein HQL47_02000 [Gammaproteobacteria bacterium]|nr:hypothetical protein [Gammaproteobacteria bacterium]
MQMRISLGTVILIPFALIFLWLPLVGLNSAPPWPFICDYPSMASHPNHLALQQAQQQVCANAGASTEQGAADATLDLTRVWPGDWQRVEFFLPYRTNASVIQRVGFDLHLLSCSRSHNQDEWQQVILINADGSRTGFDIQTHLLKDLVKQLSRSRAEAKVSISCPAPAAAKG